MKYFIFSLLFISVLSLSSQTNQGEYLEAKRQFGLGNYTVAKQAFQNISNDRTLGEYASFYYALSAMKLEQLKLAEDMLKQIQVKSSKWDQQQEVNYWLTYLAFKQGKFQDAFLQAKQLSKHWKHFLIDDFLGKMSTAKLDSLHTIYPHNRDIGKHYAHALQKQPYNSQDHSIFSRLTKKFELSSSLGKHFPSVKKEEYAIAVVLPFMFESLRNPQTVIRNTIIFDLYQGMDLARKNLRDSGIKLNLFPFDTKKKGDTTLDLINNKKLDNADVIIGPLYSEPSAYISQFSKKNQITMINPVSSNEEVIGNNPFSYLFKPSYSTQGREAAKFAARKFSDKKNLFIFYETNKDSLIASAYRETIEKDSFLVVRFERLTNESAQEYQHKFTQKYEVSLDLKYSRKQIDSIASIPGRTVETRVLKDKKTGKIILSNRGKEILQSYEKRFEIQADSIGHIFVATSSNLLANNFINMVEVRNDNIGIIGYKDWLNFSLVSYTQLERIQVNYLNPFYYDEESAEHTRIKNFFIKTIGKEPSEYHIYGYELISHLGHLMDKHGKYFQRGWLSGDFNPGYIMEGVRYGSRQDNQVVPITTLKNLKLKKTKSPTKRQ